jgi:AcrR family transcriptional regulator
MPRRAFTKAEIEAVRERILKETGSIISAHGYGALSMRKLASTLSLTAGALYRYFPTKQDLLVAYCLESLSELENKLKRISEDEESPLSVLEQMLVAYGEFALADADRFRVLFLDYEVTRLTIPGAPGLESYDFLIKAVEGAQASGRFRPLPTKSIARILFASVHGICILSATMPDIDFSDARPLAVEAAKNALRGLLISSEEI